jgi:hypothetical protein
MEMDKDMDTDIPMDMSTTWKYLKQIVLISGYRTDPIFLGGVRPILEQTCVDIMSNPIRFF